MLIGLHGRKQAGKDTVHRRIAALYGREHVVRVSFADLLYRSAAAALGVRVEQLNGWKTDPDVHVEVRRAHRPTEADDIAWSEPVAWISVREYLQRYGTEAHRDVFGPDFWTDQVDLSHEGRIVVVTDVRFPNEAEKVRREGGWVVQVIGPEAVEKADDGHASETPLPPHLVDFALLNAHRDDYFESLDAAVRGLMRGINRKTTPA